MCQYWTSRICRLTPTTRSTRNSVDEEAAGSRDNFDQLCIGDGGIEPWTLFSCARFLLSSPDNNTQSE